MSEPLLKEMRRVYRSSNQKRLDDLLREESRWKRKLTIAQNKLADVRANLNKLAQEIVIASIREAK